MYRKDAEILGKMNPEDAKRYIMAYLQYEVGEPVEKYFQDGDPLQFLFLKAIEIINSNEEKYKETVEKRREAGKKGGEAKAKNEMKKRNETKYPNEDEAVLEENEAGKTPQVMIRDFMSTHPEASDYSLDVFEDEYPAFSALVFNGYGTTEKRILFNAAKEMFTQSTI